MTHHYYMQLGLSNIGIQLLMFAIGPEYLCAHTVATKQYQEFILRNAQQFCSLV